MYLFKLCIACHRYEYLAVRVFYIVSANQVVTFL